MTDDRHLECETVVRRAPRSDDARTLARYTRALAADPNDTHALLKVGDSQIRRGAHEEAAATYRRAGNVLAAQGHALRAIAIYTTVWELVTERPMESPAAYAEIPFTIADLYARSEMLADAIATLENAARFHMMGGTFAEAARILGRATELSHESVPLRLKLAEALSRARNVEGSAAELGVAAWLLVAKGRADDALPVIERLLHLRPDAAFARLAANLYLSHGTRHHATLALKKLKICMRAYPQDLEALRLLVRAFEILGHVEKIAAVESEIADIVARRGLPVEEARPVSARAPEERGEPTDGGVHIIPVSVESWNAIASAQGEASGGMLVAFVCTSGSARNTLRTIYGVVKTLEG